MSLRGYVFCFVNVWLQLFMVHNLALVIWKVDNLCFLLLLSSYRGILPAVDLIGKQILVGVSWNSTGGLGLGKSCFPFDKSVYFIFIHRCLNDQVIIMWEQELYLIGVYFIYLQVFYFIGFGFFCLEAVLSIWVIQVSSGHMPVATVFLLQRKSARFLIAGRAFFSFCSKSICISEAVVKQQKWSEKLLEEPWEQQFNESSTGVVWHGCRLLMPLWGSGECWFTWEAYCHLLFHSFECPVWAMLGLNFFSKRILLLTIGNMTNTTPYLCLSPQFLRL